MKTKKQICLLKSHILLYKLLKGSIVQENQIWVYNLEYNVKKALGK